MPLQIGYQELEGGYAVITVAGRLTQGPQSEEIEAIVKDLLAKGVRKIMLDFSELGHIDSTGIGRCIAAVNLIMQAGGNMGIVGAQGTVREGFRVTQLDRVIPFFEDVAAAKAAFG